MALIRPDGPVERLLDLAFVVNVAILLGLLLAVVWACRLWKTILLGAGLVAATIWLLPGAFQ